MNPNLTEEQNKLIEKIDLVVDSEDQKLFTELFKIIGGYQIYDELTMEDWEQLKEFFITHNLL